MALKTVKQLIIASNSEYPFKGLCGAVKAQHCEQANVHKEAVDWFCT